MKRYKIDYGIDLGTTNSAIARMQGGKATISKSDTLKDTMPSCIGFNKKKSTQSGDSATNALRSDRLRAMKTWRSDKSNYFIEFKRTMGTDHGYESSYMGRSYSSEELSAEVLKKLKSFITDESFYSAVITVPAKFTMIQKDATRRAGQLAGFQHVELLQEPIAASMAYGLDNQQKDGYWMVFDFGGGTFDAALLKVEEGIMQVVDTEGDNYLGGKNLDYAIVDEIIIPYLEEEYVIDSIMADEGKRSILREAMKYYAEETKIQLSFKDSHNILSDLGDIPGEDDEGEEFELDITVTHESVKPVLGPIFQKAIDLTKGLLQRNHLQGSQLSSLILVGGPTYSPILRDMLAAQICSPDTSTDPMTAVAKGAALYASTVDVDEDLKETQRDRTKVQLEIVYEATTVEQEEWIAIKTLPHKTEGTIPEPLYAEFVRGDQAWSSGKVQINATGEVIETQLVESRSNAFEVRLYNEAGDPIPCEPGSFTIIQGAKIGSATLPYHLGIEIMDPLSERAVFQSIKGLEKNQSLPAVGVINGLKTQKQIRPGIAQDEIKIPIYQGEHNAEGSRAIYNEHVNDVVITGGELPAMLPEGSEVELTVKVDRSEKMTLEVFFPYLEHQASIDVPITLKEVVDESWLSSEIQKAHRDVGRLEDNGHTDPVEVANLQTDLEYLDKRFQQGRQDPDRRNEVLEGLRKSMRRIDELNLQGEWPRLEEELRDQFNRLERVQEDLGNEESARQIETYRKQVDEVIRKQDVKLGKKLLKEVHHFFFQLTFLYQLIGFLQQHQENFNRFHWKDANRARQLLNQGLQVASQSPTVENLHPIVLALIELLPDSEVSETGLLTR